MAIAPVFLLVNWLDMARVLDYRQPFVLALDLDSNYAGWCLSVQGLGPDVVVVKKRKQFKVMKK